MNIIGKRNAFIVFTGVLMALSIGAILLLGFKEGIDFQGGALLNIDIPNVSSPEQIESFLKEKLQLNSTVVKSSGDGYLIRLETITEENHQVYLKNLTEKYPGLKELSFQSIGPVIGKELKNNSMIALLLVLLGISLYVAFAFRKASYPVASWKYGVVTLISLFHDILVPAGLVAFLGYSQGLEIDTNFIVALLVVMGFSVHDTIVVFDRIRENLIHSPSSAIRKADSKNNDKYNFNSIVNVSINETIVRSLNTSLTLILVLIALLIFGPITLTNFILILLVGVTAGTYSSIFVASPLLTFWYDYDKKSAKR